MEAPGSYRTLRRLCLQKGGQAGFVTESPCKHGQLAGGTNKQKRLGLVSTS